jgi:DNA-binding LacI/PurR family transcriptional regulator
MTRIAGRATIRDVAQRAGVSPITASRALSRPELVRDETRHKVLAAAQELDYLPNLAAQTLTGSRSRMIGVVVPTLANPIFADALQALSEGLAQAGYQLLMGSNEYDLDAEERLIRTFIARRADALVLTGTRRTAAADKLIRNHRIPMLEIWNVHAHPRHYMVGLSHFEAARTMGRYLLSKGYRRIAYIGGRLRNNDRATARYRGFARAMTEAGRQLDQSLVVETDFSFEGGVQAMAQVLAARRRPDAVFASSDVVALGAYVECRRRSVRIPQDLALAGFDDGPTSALVEPGLTTIRIPRREIGLRAAQVALALIHGQGEPRKAHDLGFELVIRGSA